MHSILGGQLVVLALLDPDLESSSRSDGIDLLQSPLTTGPVVFRAPPRAAHDPPTFRRGNSQRLLLPLPSAQQAAIPQPHKVRLISALTALESFIEPFLRGVGMRWWNEDELVELRIERVQAARERQERDRG